MRKLLLLALIAAPAWCALAHEQSLAAADESGLTTISVTVTAHAVGNLWLVAGGSFTTVSNPTAFSVSDTQGNTWTPMNSYQFGGNGDGDLITWWAVAKNTSSTTVTVSYASSTNGYLSIFLDEFSGENQTNPIDQKTGVTATATSASGSVTPTANNEMVWGVDWDSPSNVGTGFTQGGNDNIGDLSEYQLLSGGSGISQTVTFPGQPTPEGYALAIVSIFPAGSGGGGGSVIKRRLVIQ
jgi:hypothetical protein